MKPPFSVFNISFWCRLPTLLPLLLPLQATITKVVVALSLLLFFNFIVINSDAAFTCIYIQQTCVAFGVFMFTLSLSLILYVYDSTLLLNRPPILHIFLIKLMCPKIERKKKSSTHINHRCAQKYQTHAYAHTQS